MNPFNQDLADGDSEAFELFGDAAQVIVGTAPEIPPRIILDRQLELVDEKEGGITVIALAGSVLLSQWPSAVRGNVIMIGARQYELGRLLRDDGAIRQFQLVGI